MFSFPGMGGGGNVDSGGIGNSKAQNENTTTTRNNESGVQGDGSYSYALGDNAHIVDGGAISAMAAALQKTLEGQTVQGAQALEFASKAGNDAFRFAYDAGRPEASTWNNTIKYAGMVIAALALAYMVVKR